MSYNDRDFLRKEDPNMSSNLTEEAKKLPVPERIALVEEIWDSIAEDNGCFELTDALKQELDRRIQSQQENPHLGRSWEEIKSEFLNSK
jgi:putative addiction module component (TIGR02574 family)